MVNCSNNCVHFLIQIYKDFEFFLKFLLAVSFKKQIFKVKY